MPNRLIAIAQNEVGHLNVNDPNNQNVGLLVMDLTNCAAVLFSDSAGNRWLMHVDDKTNLDYFRIIVKKMKGDYTVDVMVDKPTFEKNNAEGAATVAEIEIMPYLEKNFPNIKNTKNEKKIRFTNHGTVLILGGKLQTPQRKHLTEIQILNRGLLLNKAREAMPISRDNIFVDDTLDEGPRSYAARRVTRFLNVNLVEKTSLPTVVFEEGKWTGQAAKLAEIGEKHMRECLRTGGQSVPSLLQHLMKISPQNKLSVKNIQDMNCVPEYLFLRYVQIEGYDAIHSALNFVCKNRRTAHQKEDAAIEEKQKEAPKVEERLKTATKKIEQYALQRYQADQQSLEGTTLKLTKLILRLKGDSQIPEERFMQLQLEESFLAKRQVSMGAPFLKVVSEEEARAGLSSDLQGNQLSVAGMVGPSIPTMRDLTPQEKQSLGLGKQKS